MKTLLWDVICFGVLCVILTLGLWPFHSPKNEVDWLPNRNGIRFGRDGTVMSSRAFQFQDGENAGSGSIEVWVQPTLIWDSGTFLSLYSPGNPHPLMLRQSQVDLELRSAIGDDPHPPKPARLYVPNAFRRSGPLFATVVSGSHGTAIYTDGVLARKVTNLRATTKEFTGRLILGDAPRQPDNWSGLLLGVAIYGRELTAAQVLRHYQSWKQQQKPAVSEGDGNIALYLFDERLGNLVHDQARSGVNLWIPQEYGVLDKIFLEPFWEEFSMSRSYWSSAFKNIVGFVPFGFCFFACLSAHKLGRAVLATVVLGTLVSLSIEILQAYLPTRDSGTTDIFTNTLGTYMGVIACRVVCPILAVRFSWLPFVAPPRG